MGEETAPLTCQLLPPRRRIERLLSVLNCGLDRHWSPSRAAGRDPVRGESGGEGLSRLFRTTALSVGGDEQSLPEGAPGRRRPRCSGRRARGGWRWTRAWGKSGRNRKAISLTGKHRGRSLPRNYSEVTMRSCLPCKALPCRRADGTADAHSCRLQDSDDAETG